MTEKDCTADENRGCIMKLVAGKKGDKFRLEYKVTAEHQAEYPKGRQKHRAMAEQQSPEMETFV